MVFYKGLKLDPHMSALIWKRILIA